CGDAGRGSGNTATVSRRDPTVQAKVAHPREIQRQRWWHTISEDEPIRTMQDIQPEWFGLVMARVHVVINLLIITGLVLDVAEERSAGAAFARAKYHPAT